MHPRFEPLQMFVSTLLAPYQTLSAFIEATAEVDERTAHSACQWLRDVMELSQQGLLKLVADVEIDPMPESKRYLYEERVAIILQLVTTCETKLNASDNADIQPVTKRHRVQAAGAIENKKYLQSPNELTTKDRAQLKQLQAQEAIRWARLFKAKPQDYYRLRNIPFPTLKG